MPEQNQNADQNYLELSDNSKLAQKPIVMLPSIKNISNEDVQSIASSFSYINSLYKNYQPKKKLNNAAMFQKAQQSLKGSANGGTPRNLGASIKSLGGLA